jgi:hypothetical protein
MARSKRMSVQKRLRERKKAEKAELKRATTQRRSAEAERPAGVQVAARSDLEAYGLVAGFSDPPSES